MAFTKLSIGRTGARQAADPEHPADTDIWTVFRALRDSRSVFGLRPGHLQTLQAMLSFLRPGHGDTVFASNNELCRRIGGIDERTLRRHIDRFIEIGLMKRHDSPNGKRYRVRSSAGHSISYGLSLTPLMDRANELVAYAQKIENERRDRMFLRKQILTTLAKIEETDPQSVFPREARKALRRKLSMEEYGALLAEANSHCGKTSTAVDAPESIKLPANDGQTARHQSKSEKEGIDLEHQRRMEMQDVRTLISVCDQAASFASNLLRDWVDVEHHARTLAPMMGIHPDTFDKARKRVGSQKAASAIFIMLQIGNRIRNFGAYFHSITLGRREQEFNPTLLLQRLSSADAAMS